MIFSRPGHLPSLNLSGSMKELLLLAQVPVPSPYVLVSSSSFSSLPLPHNLSWPVDLHLYTNPLPVSERPCLNRASLHALPSISAADISEGQFILLYSSFPLRAGEKAQQLEYRLPAEDSSSQNLPGSSKPLVTPAPRGSNISSSLPRHCTDTHTQFKIKIKPYLSLLKACPLSECSH